MRSLPSHTLRTAEPRGIGSWSFDLHEGEEVVASVVVRRLQDEATLDVGGVPFALDKEGLMAPTFSLRFEGVELARAHRPSQWRRQIEVTVSASLLGQAAPYRLTLRADGPFTNNFVVDAGSKRVGSVRRRSLFRREADVRLPDALPIGVHAFLLALVVLEWRRTSRRSAS